MPWTTSSFSDVQMEAGNPLYPLNDGVAPSDLIDRSAIWSRSEVVMPGATSSSSRSMVRAVIAPALRMSSISEGDLYSIIASPRRPVASGRLLVDAGQRLHGRVGHLVGRVVGVDLAEQPELLVER